MIQNLRDHPKSWKTGLFSRDVLERCELAGGLVLEEVTMVSRVFQEGLGVPFQGMNLLNRFEITFFNDKCQTFAVFTGAPCSRLHCRFPVGSSPMFIKPPGGVAKVRNDRPSLEMLPGWKNRFSNGPLIKTPVLSIIIYVLF